MVLTTDRSYFAAIKPIIKFNSVDDSQTYFTFNAHENSNQPLIVNYLDCEDSMGETGSFNIGITDNDNVVNKDHIRNAKVYIDLGKTTEELQHFLIGYVDIFDINRPGTNAQDYRLSGFGSAIQASELLLLIRKSAKVDDDDNLINDASFSVGNLFEDSLNEKKYRPLNDQKIKNITHWASRGIDTLDLKTQLLVLNEEFTTLADFYDRLCALEGSDWFIDYTDGDENLTVKHPSKLHSGITIKSSDLRLASDDATKISYIKSPFTITEDSSMNAGVRTGLYTTTIIDRDKVAESKTNNGSTNLNKRFIGQQITLPNDQRRITSLAFKLHKVGEPDSPKGRVNGRIILDDGNNKPKGTIVSEFSLSLSEIDDNSDWIVVDDINISTKNFQGITKLWLILLDRSGIKGNVEDDPNNTVLWHHDASFTAHTAGTYSATASISSEGDRDNVTGVNWNVSTNGPVYTYKIYSDIKRLLSRQNQSAAALLRKKEQFIDSSFLHKPSSINKFLSLNLSPMSQPRISISNIVVTVPNNFIFRPYKYVTFIDGLSGYEQDLQVVRAAYRMSGLPGDPQYGTYDAELTLSGSYNTIIGSCSCL